jgi:hypothetical protein
VGAVLLSLFLVVLLAPGVVWPLVNGRRIRARGFDPEVFPHNTRPAVDRAPTDRP